MPLDPRSIGAHVRRLPAWSGGSSMHAVKILPVESAVAIMTAPRPRLRSDPN